MRLKRVAIGLAVFIIGILAVSLVLRVGSEPKEADILTDESVSQVSGMEEDSETLPNPTSTIQVATTTDDSGIVKISQVLLAQVPMEELIEESTIIAVGQVGEIVATDYPAVYQTELPPEDDLDAQENYNRQVYTHRLAFHEFIVSETLKGESFDSFIFSRTDVAHYEKINISELLPGSRILLFVREHAKPELLTNKVDHFYGTRGDNGIFDLDDQDRAFPRAPGMFQELTTEDGYYDANSLNPYFDLEKLKANISK